MSACWPWLEATLLSSLLGIQSPKVGLQWHEGGVTFFFYFIFLHFGQCFRFMEASLLLMELAPRVLVYLLQLKFENVCHFQWLFKSYLIYWICSLLHTPGGYGHISLYPLLTKCFVCLFVWLGAGVFEVNLSLLPYIFLSVESVFVSYMGQWHATALCDIKYWTF